MKKLQETWKQVKPHSAFDSRFPAQNGLQGTKAKNSKETKRDNAQNANRTRFLGRIAVSSTPNVNSDNFARSNIPNPRIHNDTQFQLASIVLQNKNTSAGRLEEHCTTTGQQSQDNSFSCTFDKQMLKACDELEREELKKATNPDCNTTPTSDPNLPSLSLLTWNLPNCVVEKYAANGVDCMFPWQRACLLLPGVLDGGNLVYSAPTSAGKTMVAEILLLKRVVEKKKKAIFVLPFVSVTREKTFYLQHMFQDAGVKVGGFMGGQHPPGGFAAVDVALCTIEKANSLVNRLIEEGTLNNLGILVVDELHMLGDPSRGYLLELLLTKIIYLQNRKRTDINGDEIATPEPIQIVGMSATLPNLDLLAKWLGATLYRTDYRPVPLQEFIKIDSAVYDNRMTKIRDVPASCAIPGDNEHVAQLCMEMVSNNHGTLVFCPSKKWCETLACNLATEISKLGSDESQELNPDLQSVRDGLRAHLDGNSLRDVLEQLSRTPVGLDAVLRTTVAFGVAFHHAGLTFDERDVIEGAFRQGILKIIVATSTLSSGVNLPARRVIIRTPMSHGNQLLDVLVYRQMTGRAGRKGVDTEGESILMCKPNEGPRAKALAQSLLRPVSSCLVCNEREGLSGSLKRAILEIVVGGIANTTRDVEEYMSCTLLAADFTSGDATRTAAIKKCVQFLQENEFVKKSSLDLSNDATFSPTCLGSAVLASALSPNEGLVVFEELERARRGFVLENELHLVYQVTPIYVSSQWPNMDWLQYLDIWNRLGDGMKRVAKLVGVNEEFLQRAADGRVRKDDLAQRRCLDTHLRFYAALSLHDLVNEVPLSVVAQKYGCNRGMLQSLQQTASSFAGMVTVFCNRLGWVSLELLIAQFQSRLHFGVQRELIDLVRLPSLSGKYARFLYDRGLPTAAALANANLADVKAILRNARPFESERQRDGETEKDAADRKERCCIRFPGKKGMTELEAAKVLIAEAREMVQKELGIKIQWQPADTEIKAEIDRSKVQPPPAIEPNNAEELLEANLNSRDDGTVVLSPNKLLSPTSSPHVSPQAIQILRRSQRNRRKPRSRSRNKSLSFFSAKGSVTDNLISAFQEKWKTSPCPTTSKTNSTPVKLAEKEPCYTSPKLAGKEPKDVTRDHDRSPILVRAKPAIPIHSSPFSWTAMNTSSSLLQCEQTPKADCNKTFSWGSSGLEDCMLKALRDKDEDAQDSDVTNCSLELFDNSGPVTGNGENVDRDDQGMPQKEDSFLQRSINMSSIEFQPNLDPVIADSIIAATDFCSDVIANGKRQLPDLNRLNNDSPSPKRGNYTDEEDIFISPTPAVNGHRCDSAKVTTEEDEEFCIVDVTADRELFAKFIAEWKTKSEFSVSVACEPKLETANRGGDIGVNRATTSKSTAEKDKHVIVYDRNAVIVGLSVCWEGKDAYYVTLKSSCIAESDEGLVAPPACANLPTREIINAITDVMLLTNGTSRSCISFDAKSQIKCLREMTGVLPNYSLKDPKVAEWLLNPTGREQSLAALVSEFLADYSPLLSAIANLKGVGSIALDCRAQISGRVRSATESVVTHHLMPVLENELRVKHLHCTFIDIEMPIVSILAKMEMNGFGFSAERCQLLQNCLQSKLRNLEEEAYSIAGRRFSLTSPNELSQVLYVELSLPPPNFQDVGIFLRRNIRSPRVAARPKLPKNYTVSKDGLEKLAVLHRMPAIVLEWRKISSALSKVIVPLLKLHMWDAALNMHRMRGNCITHTATGRVSMAEPNLQNVHRDFEVSAISESAPKHNGAVKAARYSAIVAMSPYRTRSSATLNVVDTTNISIRDIFIPFQGGVLLSADYCQLELRILAHLSKDSNLLNALTDGRDAFRTMASQWKGIDYQQVTDEDRQQAKHICYGMIYGIGLKALGEQLNVSQEEAAVFIATFKDKYPGVKTFLNSSVEACRKNGYVETVFGRRRYIPNILSVNSHWRSQAERQAVNTPIQGSAADVVKEAMIAIDRQLAVSFPGCRRSQMNPRNQSKASQTGFLVLQLHDELLYELNEDDLVQFAQIVKMKMEETANISIPLPVRVKAGPSWASLKDLDL